MTTLADLTADLINDVLNTVDQLKVTDLPQEEQDKIAEILAEYLEAVKTRLIGIGD